MRLPNHSADRPRSHAQGYPKDRPTGSLAEYLAGYLGSYPAASPPDSREGLSDDWLEDASGDPTGGFVARNP
jgi:hypothetical protein